MDMALPAEQVVRVLEQVVAWRGYRRALRLDNDPELLADRCMTWCTKHGIEVRYIQPGKPAQNGFIERFFRRLKESVQFATNI